MKRLKDYVIARGKRTFYTMLYSGTFGYIDGLCLVYWVRNHYKPNREI